MNRTPRPRRLPFRCLVLLPFLAACASTSAPPPAPAAGAADAAGPGFGYPDPLGLMKAAVDAYERRDTTALRDLFAIRNASGDIVLLTSVTDGGRAWPPEALVAPLRAAVHADYLRVEYGPPRNLRNRPPVVAIPMYVRYDYDRVPEDVRARIARTASTLEKRTLTWDDVVARLEATWTEIREKRRPMPEMTFVHLDDAWRFLVRD